MSKHIARTNDNIMMIFHEVDQNGIGTIINHPLMGQIVSGTIHTMPDVTAMGKVDSIRRVKFFGNLVVVIDIERTDLSNPASQWVFVSLEATSCQRVCECGGKFVSNTVGSGLAAIEEIHCGKCWEMRPEIIGLVDEDQDVPF